MDLFHIILLSIVQGITEWLPISSSGHLVLLQEYFNLNVPLSFDIFLHLASVFVLFVFFRMDILYMFRAVKNRNFNSDDGRLFLFIIIASIPTAIIGFLFQDIFEGFFTNVLWVGIAFVFCGSLIFITRKRVQEKEIDFKKSFLIGIMQGIALIPGISRSGGTISVGLLLGIDRKKALRFSFLLVIPAILGAFFFKLKEFVGYEISLDYLIISFFVTFLVGYFTLKLLIKIVNSGKFYYFAYYCWAVGLWILIFKL
ncbi:undecaprenyl-diphosphate phosphatase [Candidatus Woesearchaeota archaeon]|nr:undecaprenyl-diphosphate phosphatase [Candidatus Woesearchaeota archaeon]